MLPKANMFFAQSRLKEKRKIKFNLSIKQLSCVFELLNCFDYRIKKLPRSLYN